MNTSRRPVPRRPLATIRRALAALAIAALLVGGAAAQPGRESADTAKKTVLVLSSERSDLPSISDFDRGLRAGLAQPAGRTELFVEYLDFGRFAGPDHERGFARYLRDRYAGRPVDVVVPTQESAFEFLLKYRAELFPVVPVVGAGIERRHVEGRALPAGVTTIPISYDYRRTLALALALQPGAREVVVIHGISDYDLRRREEARAAVEGVVPGLRYRALGGVPLPAIEEAVRRLPADSFVLLVSMVRDAEGRPLAGRHYAARLAAVSPVPIFGTFPSHMENGTLGGALTDFTEIGRATASVATRILSGDLPSKPVAIEPAPPALRVNARALERWGIPPDRVPADAEILFREPGLWDRYRGLIVAVAATVLLQGLLITGLVLQLSRRRRAESALRESEGNLRLAVEAVPMALLMVNRQGTIVLANAQAERLLGYGPAELTEQRFDMLVPERFRDGHAGLPGFFATASRDEVLVRCKDGNEIPIEVGLHPLQTRDGLLVLAAIVDLRERRQLQRTREELEHVGRVSTMGEIAASLAHELSQPLAAILSNAQAGLRLIERGNPDQAEIVEILRDVVADDKRAGEVIGALRTMLRRGKTERAVIDAAQAVRNVLSLLHGEIVKDQVEVRQDLADGCPIFANTAQIQQVLLNLLMNAIEAMRPQPAGERRLWIDVAQTAERSVRIAIRDSGIGIPAHELDKVFDAFFTTKPHGMGMGLAVCRSIVRSHGGDLRAEASGDRGATLVCTLPLAA